MFDVANSVRTMNEEPSPDASGTISRLDSQDTRDLCFPLPEGEDGGEGIDPVRRLLFVR
jgi:hypothetical protein